MAEGRFVAYYRVSTQRQGASGLGLDAQQQAVRDYLNGGEWQLVEEFVEVESGKRNDRPELKRALAACRRLKAKLVIAKLDRLARNVAFIANLMESGVEFVAVDNPHANKPMLHMMAAFAEHEAAMISDRTKKTLAVVKARGVKLGGKRVSEERHTEIRAAGRLAHTAKAEAFKAQIKPVIECIKAEGHTSLSAIAKELNERGIATPRGDGLWQATSVMRVLGAKDRPAA